MYGSIQDMVLRFGEIEMLRLSTADGDVPDTILPERIEGALKDASDLIDSYLRVRYRTPLIRVPVAIVRASCILARFDLAHGTAPDPSDQATKARDEVIAWLKRLADGAASLEDENQPGTASANVTFHDRERIFSDKSLRGW